MRPLRRPLQAPHPASDLFPSAPILSPLFSTQPPPIALPTPQAGNANPRLHMLPPQPTLRPFSTGSSQLQIPVPTLHPTSPSVLRTTHSPSTSQTQRSILLMPAQTTSATHLLHSYKRPFTRPSMSDASTAILNSRQIYTLASPNPIQATRLVLVQRLRQLGLPLQTGQQELLRAVLLRIGIMLWMLRNPSAVGWTCRHATL